MTEEGGVNSESKVEPSRGGKARLYYRHKIRKPRDYTDLTRRTKKAMAYCNDETDLPGQ